MNENESRLSEKPKKERLSHKEKRARWKAAKKAKKQELREYYRYAPWPKRVWNLWLKKLVRTVFILLLVFGLLAANADAIVGGLVVPALRGYYESVKNRPLAEEDIAKIYELAPIDEQGSARIDALPPIGADETWTISLYFVGADLEDDGENDLSYVTSVLTRDLKAQRGEQKRQALLDRLTRFNGELASNGLELPRFYYYPEIPVASSTVMTEEVHVSKRLGKVSGDIAELCSGPWSDRIQIVMQTGGATHWSNNMVNPNRTQRFLYKNGEFSEVADLPLQPASETETLADFLRFCRDEYPADHNILILWNHGGGPFGFGMDSIHGGMFSLKDIRAALESVYQPDSEKPAFDMIGFDACLMSCLEVTKTLDGFADYYCLSEEGIPGDGWDYAPWLQAMTDDPTMSPAKVCREIADSYTDYYMIQNINMPLFENNVTFAVLDAHKTGALYEAYGELAKAQLRDAVSDLGILAEIGRCGRKATRYGDTDANVFNTADLGNYVDYMADSYPDECAKIRELLGEAVLYHRENGALCDSTGIAVYLPTEVNTLPGLSYYLDYIYNISEDDNVRALYYYKQAGCLNEELKKQVKTLTDLEPKVLDVTPFTNFSRVQPGFDESGFYFPVEQGLTSLMTDYQLELGRYDPDAESITYYGRDEVLKLDGEGRLRSGFDGSWICLNGEPLYVEVVSSSASGVEYMAHVTYDGDEAYLMISCDRDTGSFSLNGVRLVDTNNAVNSLASSRSRLEPEAGKVIVPIYKVTNLNNGETKNEPGKKIYFTTRTSITRELLPEGSYLSTAVISDSRGDHYYSRVIGSEVSGKAMTGWKLDDRFMGRDY